MSSVARASATTTKRSSTATRSSASSRSSAASPRSSSASPSAAAARSSGTKPATPSGSAPARSSGTQSPAPTGSAAQSAPARNSGTQSPAPTGSAQSAPARNSGAPAPAGSAVESGRNSAASPSDSVTISSEAQSAAASTAGTSPVNFASWANPNQSATDWARSKVGLSMAANPTQVQKFTGGKDEAWCAHFASSAFENTGGSPFGHKAAVKDVLKWGQDRPGKFLDAEQARANPGQVRSGDLVVWKQEGASHTGIVSGVNTDKGTFSTIEGNAEGAVRERTYAFKGNDKADGNGPFADNQLSGFVRPRGQFGVDPTAMIARN